MSVYAAPSGSWAVGPVFSLRVSMCPGAFMCRSNGQADMIAAMAAVPKLLKTPYIPALMPCCSCGAATTTILACDGGNPGRSGGVGSAQRSRASI